jgi:hypothetical protein
MGKKSKRRKAKPKSLTFAGAGAASSVGDDQQSPAV